MIRFLLRQEAWGFIGCRCVAYLSATAVMLVCVIAGAIAVAPQDVTVSRELGTPASTGLHGASPRGPSDTYLLVSSFFDNTVQKYDITTGDYLGVCIENIAGPRGLALRPNGNILVASQTDRTVYEYEADCGNRIGEFVTQDPKGVLLINFPADIAFMPSTGNLLVTTTWPNAHYVLEYDGKTGVHMGAFADHDDGLSFPVGLAFDANGDLFVSNVWNNKVIKFDGVTREVLLEFGPPQLQEPFGIVVRPNGNVLVSSTGTGEVLSFNGTTGVFLGPCLSGLQPGPLLFTDIGNLLVGDHTLFDEGIPTTHDQILEYDSGCGFIRTLTEGGSMLRKSMAMLLVAPCFGPDGDGDNTPDICDGCPNDPNKTAPGDCGCGIPDVDSDGDSVLDCFDVCPGFNDNDDFDGDDTPDGCDTCTDSDGDLWGDPGFPANKCPDDGCPADPQKIAPGICGCGVADTDSDGDGMPDCVDECPDEPALTSPSEPGGEISCDDGIDNDCDGLTDGADPDCGTPSCLCGDLNGDGDVNLGDFPTFAGCFGLTSPVEPCGSPEFLCSDLDGDGEITLNDFVTFAGLFGQPAAGSPPNCD